jgi:hypothetical protein
MRKKAENVENLEFGFHDKIHHRKQWKN